jgi:hypothetical protein
MRFSPLEPLLLLPFTRTGEQRTPDSSDSAEAMLMLLGDADLKEIVAILTPPLPLPPEPESLLLLLLLLLPLFPLPAAMPPTIGVNCPRAMALL